MEWDDLKHFLAVARSGSLTEAARGLKASAATVGRHIESLEKRLDARLFEHRSTGYVLTSIGQSILEKAESVEAAVLAVEREAQGNDFRLSGTVRIATTEDLGAMVITPALPDFRARHPGVDVEIVARIDLSNLTRRDADLALRTVRPERGDLLVRRIGAVDLAVYASRTYAAARSLTIESFAFEKVEIVTWVEELSTFRGGAWLSEHAARSPVALRVNTTRLLFDACRAGLGAAVLPCFGADADPDLVCLLPPQPGLSFDTGIVMHRDLAQTARVRAVADFLASLGPRLGRARSSARLEPETEWH